ncbi:MAG: hypothetical protein QME94_15185, partial [Anaerolineae bacterium]|nr:hypothetical protein [Anaerolineae bacterium]
NEALRPFGYRLVAKEKPGYGYAFYDLYKGDQPVLSDLSAVWPVAVTAAGDDFALLVEGLNGPHLLVSRSGTERWDPGQHHYRPPVYVGEDLVTVSGVG